MHFSIENRTAMDKIFGIGLNRTGTGSLAAALRILGYKVSHWTHHTEICQQLALNRFDFPFLEEYDAVLDLPIPAIYKELHQHYPNAKFIYTWRDFHSWINSHKKMYEKLGDIPLFETKLVYGDFKFNRHKWFHTHENHNKEVLKYFKKKDKNFISLRYNNNHWEELCKFLDKPIPDEPWPHVNKL